jgi:hypothetical protein
LFWDTYKTHKCTLWTECELLNVKPDGWYCNHHTLKPKRPWKVRWQLWPTLDNKNYIWQAQWFNVTSYWPTENLVADETIVLFKQSHFQIVYTKETQKVWGQNLRTLRVHLGKDRQHTSSSMTATHMTARLWKYGTQTIHWQLCFISCVIWHFTYQDNYCENVGWNRKQMPKILGKMQLKLDDIKTKVKYTFDSYSVEGQQNLNISTNMCSPPMEVNFCNEHRKTVKQVIVQDHTRCTEYVPITNCMTISYSISKHAWKWTKKLFFCTLDLTILNSFIVFASCGSKKIINP